MNMLEMITLSVGSTFAIATILTLSLIWTNRV